MSGFRKGKGGGRRFAAPKTVLSCPVRFGTEATARGVYLWLFLDTGGGGGGGGSLFVSFPCAWFDVLVERWRI